MDYYKRALQLKEETVLHRRYLHRNAETGLQLPKTAEYVFKTLEGYGIAPQRCGCGITATIGSGKGAILLRADMDALPLKEDSGVAFACKTGNFHGCGHDMHTAMLLCAAKLLKEAENRLCGRVMLVFQGGEETLEGSSNMLSAGFFNTIMPQCAMALHVAAGKTPVGSILYNSHGTMMYSAHNFRIELKGKGGHGAYPHLAKNPIPPAAEICTALTRAALPYGDKAVLSVCHIEGGCSHNTIPDTAVVEGTLRTADTPTADALKTIIETLPGSLAQSHSTKANVLWLSSAPPLVCHKKLCDEMVNYLRCSRIPDLTFTDGMQATASEDFANIAQLVPSVMFYLGAGFKDERGRYTAHHPKVLFNEECLPTGAAVYAHCAESWLKQNRR